MADIKLRYGSPTSLTVTGLSTLANATSATSATIDNSTNLFMEYFLEVLFTTDAGATATGTVEVWVKGSTDNTDFDDDTNDRLAAVISLPGAGAGSRKRIVPVAPAFGGFMPIYFQVRIRNNTGAALTAGTVFYTGAAAQTT